MFAMSARPLVITYSERADRRSNSQRYEIRGADSRLSLSRSSRGPIRTGSLLVTTCRSDGPAPTHTDQIHVRNQLRIDELPLVVAPLPDPAQHRSTLG